ncbi:hypothetical protein ACP275_09G050500 [Erythranthe tilingii]
MKERNIVLVTKAATTTTLLMVEKGSKSRKEEVVTTINLHNAFTVKLNKHIWSRGISSVPKRIRIRIARKRNDDEDANEEI